MVKPFLLYLPMKIFESISKALLSGFFICMVCVACGPSKPKTITILHTNDTHSQVEPIEEGKRDANCAGYARRMGFIERERQLDPDLILLDAGDFSQGTPYFNFYHGRIEMDALNRMGYDAGMLGNHEFDYGVDTLAVIFGMAQFPIVCANYDVCNTPLESLVKPYTILHKKGLRIGVFGIGVNPNSLIAMKNFEPVKYLNPIESAQKVATMLRHDEHCDVVVCISHQGTNHIAEGQVCDVELAAATRDIDVIIGAHTHKVVENLHIANMDGDSVLLAQTGKSGARIGKITLEIGQ